MYLDDILRERYAPLRRLSPRTLDLYSITLRHFDRWLATVEDRSPGQARVDDLTDLVVARFVAAREVERCAVTAKKDRTQLLALWRYCARKRLVDQFPELPPMRVPERIPRAYTAADLDRLLEYFAGIDGQVAGVPASSWWSSLVRVLFETGGRITETLSVEWTDLNIEARTILLRAENRKARTRDIVREISTETAAALAARRRPTGRVWPWAMTDKYLWAKFRGHCGRAGVTYRKGFHAIRKAACSYTAAAGGDATALADHADAATTRRHYLDPSIVKVESNLARLPRLGGGEVVDTAASEEQALRAGYQAGIALAAAGVSRPDRAAVTALARAAGFTAHATLYGHGLALAWGGHSNGDSAGGIAGTLATVTE